MAPKYPCGSCSKEVTKAKKSLACNVCEMWFHYECLVNPVDGMTEGFYASCAEAWERHSYSAFFCKCCRKATSKINGSMDEIKKENERLREKIEVLEKIVDRMYESGGNGK